jgi:cystathionine beta-lyase family protein involved in aluminum resistance
MFKVIYEDQEKNFTDLVLAMEHAKTLPHFVTISGGGYDIVGRFGVDAVVAGVLPNGMDYNWKKRRI